MITTTATSGRLAPPEPGEEPADAAVAPARSGGQGPAPIDLLGGRLRAGRLSVAGLAAVLIALWFIVDPRTPDLAGQIYRVELFRQLGFALWDEHWYAGHHLPGYSLLFPALGALLGARLLGALAVLASAVLFERIVVSVYGPRARWAAAWFALAALGDIWIGRIAFALGVTLALVAVLALIRGHRVVAVVAAALCAAASPVAGVLLGLAALTAALARRSAQPLLVLVVPAAAVVLALGVLFPEGGWEPFPIRSFAATALVLAAFWWALPPGQWLLRLGAVVYLVACLLCLLAHSPMGSNIERYGVLLTGPLLLCALLGDRPGLPEVRPPLGRAALALCLSALWVVWGPVRETLAVAGSEATSAAYYLPVERFLAMVPDAPVRLEVPLTRSHWEAALLAPSVSLARGWEKQLETRYAHVLLAPGLNAATYEAWLRGQAVSYVALPDVALDPSSAAEGRLIRRGVPYLKMVFASRHWRVYRVLGATPLLSGPGRLRRLGHDGFTLDALAPGSFLVRVRYTPYWALTSGEGCVTQAPGGWTRVRLTRAGTAEVAARFSLARAFGSGKSCRTAAGG